MPSLRHLIFWQNIPSILQAPLMRELATEWSARGGDRVEVVVEGDVSAARVKQGWSRPDYGGSRLTIAPTRLARDQLLAARAGPDSVHVFSGFHLGKENPRMLRRALKTAAHVGVFAEAGRSDQGLKSLLRKAQYGFYAVRAGRRLDFLLPTGTLGADFYRRCGFPASKMFPFGYFTERKREPKRGEGTAEGTHCRFVFVGLLEPRKGLDLALSAFARLADRAWTLDVVGSGPADASLRRQAQSLNIVDQVAWRGNLPNSEVLNAMAQADYLILPSRFDGWGAVVNEALQVGTPVILSDACGARDLVGEHPWRGAKFASEDTGALADLLGHCLERGRPCRRQRDRIRDWAENAIGPAVGAKYLCEILDFVVRGTSSPEAPWEAMHYQVEGAA